MKIGAHCMNMYILYTIQKNNTYRNSASPEPAGGRIDHSPWPRGFLSECLIILCYLRPYCAAAAAAAAAAGSTRLICSDLHSGHIGGSIREQLKLLRACLQYVMVICEAV